MKRKKPIITTTNAYVCMHDHIFEFARNSPYTHIRLYISFTYAKKKNVISSCDGISSIDHYHQSKKKHTDLNRC